MPGGPARKGVCSCLPSQQQSLLVPLAAEVFCWNFAFSVKVLWKMANLNKLAEGRAVESTSEHGWSDLMSANCAMAESEPRYLR